MCYHNLFIIQGHMESFRTIGQFLSVHQNITYGGLKGERQKFLLNQFFYSIWAAGRKTSATQKILLILLLLITEQF